MCTTASVVPDFEQGEGSLGPTGHRRRLDVLCRLPSKVLRVRVRKYLHPRRGRTEDFGSGVWESSCRVPSPGSRVTPSVVVAVRALPQQDLSGLLTESLLVPGTAVVPPSKVDSGQSGVLVLVIIYPTT